MTSEELSMAPDDLEARLAACEQTNRRLRILVGIALVVGFAALLPAFLPSDEVQFADSLTVRELVVLDTSDVVRVRIGGDLPDAVVGGQTRDRGQDAAGVVLFDETGQERGGYVACSAIESRCLGQVLINTIPRFLHYGEDAASGSVSRLTSLGV